MPVINNNSTSSLPFFVENQILRASDLNALVQGLMEQLRENRTYNIGTGIVNGLNVTVEANRHLRVSSGFGISSDGYTFETTTCSFTHLRKAQNLRDCKIRTGECEEYRELLEGMNLAYELQDFSQELDQNEINEGGWNPIADTPVVFVEDNGFNESPSKYGEDLTIEDAHSLGFCLLYIWCENEVARSSCFNDCEQKGADQNMSLKVVLYPRYLYEYIFNPPVEEEEEEEGEGGEEENNNKDKINLPPLLSLPRFGLKAEESCIKLCEINSWSKFYEEYRTLCDNLIGDFDPSDESQIESPTNIIGLYYAAYECFYKLATNETENPFTELKSFLKDWLLDQNYSATNVQSCPDIQYLYTYLQELLIAYEALRKVANGMTLLGNSSDSGNEIRCLHPKHISLGAFTATDDRIADDETVITGDILIVPPASADDPPVCRSTRRLPDVFPQTLERKEKALLLFERMVKMATRANTLFPTTTLKNINLTPDIRRFSCLDSRAMPFYYKKNILANWQTPDAHYSVSYNYLFRNSEHILFTEVEPYDFYRIEGHLDQSLISVKGQIESHRSCFNLAFDIREVRIGPGTNLTEEQELSFKDLESAFLNARNTLINQLKNALQHDQTNDNSEQRINELLTQLIAYDSFEVIPSPFLTDGVPTPVSEYYCSENLPNIPTNYLDDFLAMFNGIVISGNALERDLGECVVSLAGQYYERYLSFQLENAFPSFAKAHPGLEHRGGVPRGGTFVLVYKETPNEGGNIEKIVVADFCLPYLCCSEGVIIRNEIRKINNELVIPKVEFCFDTTPETNNDNIEGSVAPVGGDLKITSSNGTTQTIASTNASYFTEAEFSISYQNLESFGLLDFSNDGITTLNFSYEIGGAPTDTKTVTIYKKPELNCPSSSTTIGNCYTPFNSEDPTNSCQYCGEYHKIDFNDNPICLNEITDLSFQILGGNTFVLKDAGVKQTIPNELDWMFVIEEDKVKEIIIPLLPGTNTTMEVTAKNNTCEASSCSIELIVPCLTDMDVAYTDFIKFNGTSFETSNIVNNEVSHTLLAENDPGFIAIRTLPTGFTMTARDASGNSLNIIIKQISAFIPDGTEPDCEEHTLYYLVYDKMNAANVNHPITGDPIFGNLSDYDDSLVFPEVGPIVITLTYTLPTFEDCPTVDKVLTVEIFPTPQARLLIDSEDTLCFDTTPGNNNDNIQGSVAPAGGNLIITSPNGTTQTIVSTDTNYFNGDTFSISYQNLNSAGLLDFTNDGSTTLNFRYEVGGTSTDPQSVAIYKTPALNCDLIIGNVLEHCYTPFDLENPDNGCEYCGERYKVDFNNTPISLNEITDLSFQIQGENPIILKAGGDMQTIPPGTDWQFVIEEDKLTEIILVLPPGTNTTMEVSAKNNTCEAPPCPISLIVPCLTDMDVAYTHILEYNGTLFETSDIDNDEVGHTLLVENDPGFIAIRMQPTGFEMIAKDENDTPLNIIIKQVSAFIPDGTTPDCEVQTLYSLVYNKENAESFTNPITGDPIFDDLSNIDNSLIFPEVGPIVIKLTYIPPPFDNCPPIEKELKVNIFPPPQPRPSDQGTEGSDGNSGNRSDTTSDSSTTNDKTEDNTESGTITTGTRGISSALISPSAGQLTAEASQLLNQRRATYEDQLDAQKALEEQFADLVKSFIGTTAGQEALIMQYQTIANAIFKSHRSLKNKERKVAQAKILTTLHHALLDKLLAQPEELSKKTYSTIRAQMKKTATAGISLTKIKRGWKVGTLRKVFDKERVNLLNGMIKA